MKKFLLGVFVCFALLAFMSCNSKVGKVTDESTSSVVMKVEAPIVSPQTGSFPAGTLITISSTTQDAVIKYTTDGSVPSSTNGVTYAQPIELSFTSIKAIAIKDKMSDSEVTAGSYSVIPPFSPQFDVVGGSYDNYKIVSLSPSHGACTEIKYSLDGSDPRNGTRYTTPITINTTGTTIRAICFNAGVTSLESSSGQYVLKAATPVISHTVCPTSAIKRFFINDLCALVPPPPPPPPPPTGTHCTSCVFLASTTTDATFKWRYVYVDGSQQGNPTITTEWFDFSNAISCSAVSLPSGVATFKIQSMATRTGMVDSDISSANFYK